jgi:purine-cytosine permease-like protein
VGVVLGGLVLAPMALLGPVTRTNNAVSSGAHFGVVGRCVGSFLSLLTAITFFAISVCDAVAGAAQRLFGFDGPSVSTAHRFQRPIGFNGRAASTEGRCCARWRTG